MPDELHDIRQDGSTLLQPLYGVLGRDDGEPIPKDDSRCCCGPSRAGSPAGASQQPARAAPRRARCGAERPSATRTRARLNERAIRAVVMARRFFEFFAATIRNRNTRMAYMTAVSRFFAWC